MLRSLDSAARGFVTLTGDASPSGAFEGQPSTFGAYAVEIAMGDGRFGPVFRAHDAAGTAVVVRTFTQTFSADQRERFLAALDALCRAPLEHPSIARPTAYGVSANGRPYVVHTFLPGTPLGEFSVASGRRGLDDIINRLTYLAGALDFAAATGVFHGALSAADVIFSSESAGVSGMGLVQALELAGVPGFHCQRQDDVTALMEIAASLIGDRITPAASSILTGPALPTALEFAGALHRIVGSEEGPAEAGHYDGPAEAAHHDRYDERPHDLFRDLDVEADRDEFRSEDVAPEPAHHDLVDLQLRHDEQKLPEPPMFGVTVPPAARPAPRRSLGWVLMAAMALAFGVFAGFVGGFFVARESPPPNPSVQTESPAPEATNGRTFTDAPVNEVPLAQPPAGSGASVSRPQPEVAKPEPPKPDSTKPAAAAPQPSRPAAPAQRNGRTAGATAASRPAPAPEAAPRTGPAAIRVESLPAGAQVFVDGRSVGYAPLIVGDLTPGTHSIRMQLPGYRPYVTAVTLGPGARERLAASLEQ